MKIKYNINILRRFFEKKRNCSGSNSKKVGFHRYNGRKPEGRYKNEAAPMCEFTENFIAAEKKEGVDMPVATSNLVMRYVELLSKIYGKHLKTVILYGSYARGDYTEDSDIDIMVLLDLSDMDIKKYRHELSGMTYDFNMDYDLDIKPIAKSKEHFNKWMDVYPFYSNVEREGVKLFDAA